MTTKTRRKTADFALFPAKDHTSYVKITKCRDGVGFEVSAPTFEEAVSQFELLEQQFGLAPGYNKEKK